MLKKIALTLACGDYEIVRPLLNEKVEVDGADLTISPRAITRCRSGPFRYFSIVASDTASCSSTLRKALQSPPTYVVEKSG
jgi:hypothetical protein